MHRRRNETNAGSTIKPGDVQRMSAGTGVMHSERNPSASEGVHFLQIWIVPSEKNIKPGYEQKTFSAAQKRGQLRLVASPDGADGSVTIHQDARLYAGLFKAGERASLALPAKRHLWVHVARGGVRINDVTLGEGDAMALTDEGQLHVEGIDDAEVLVFDLA